MPGFTTHYLFGIHAYQSLKNDFLKKTIRRQHAAYSLGLQGPDIFFYYLPSYLIHKKNIGSIAHTSNTRTFLFHLIESRNLFPDPKEEQIAHAYIMGFLGHYLLDSRCHPYVYYRTHYQENDSSYSYGDHINLEADIDAELLYFYKNKRPSAFHPEATIALTRLQLRTIATILYYVYTMTYPDLTITYTDMRLAIRSMQIGLRLLRDPHGKKKIIVRKLESFTIKDPLLSSMIPSDYLRFFADPLNTLHHLWNNPWKIKQTSSESFLDLLELAQKDYLKLLPQLRQLFLAKQPSATARRYQKNILKFLGNKSYHSGLSSDLEE